MRVGKQLFHGRVAHLGTHTRLHEGLEIRLWGQALHILQRGQWGRLATEMATARGLAMTRSRVVAIRAKRIWRRCRNITGNPVWRFFAWQAWQSAVSRILWLDRLPLAPRPATEKAFAHVPPTPGPPLRLPSVLMLTG